MQAAAWRSQLDVAGDLLFGAGSETAMIRLKFEEVVRVTDARVANIADPVAPEPAAAAEPPPPLSAIPPSTGGSRPPSPPSAAPAAAAAAVPHSPQSLLALHRTPRFLVDNMMGRLVRWLRVVGVDTEFIPHRDHDRLLTQSLQQRRIILTRDRKVCVVCARGAVVADRCPSPRSTWSGRTWARASSSPWTTLTSSSRK